MSCLVILLGVLALVSAQSGDGPTTEEFVLDEVGISLLALVGFIALVMLIGWLWFCWKICYIQKKQRSQLSKEDKQYRQRLALAQRRLREHRNVQRAMEESLAAADPDHQHQHTDDTPSVRADDEEPDFAATTNTYNYENEDDWFFDEPTTDPSHKHIAPPSFESVVSLEQPSPVSYTSYPAVTQQQRMLTTLQNIPQQDETTPTEGSHDDTHVQLPAGVRMPDFTSHPQPPSSDESDSSSTSSVNIDELLGKHLTSIPTIGLVGCGSTQRPMTSMTLVSSDTNTSQRHFKRFDPLSRTPIHPNNTKFHPLHIYSRSS